MYNRTPYNKTTYNRTTSIVFEWLATANAETDTSATLKIIRYLDGSAAAVAALADETAAYPPEVVSFLQKLIS